jgi:hypothetical protein
MFNILLSFTFPWIRDLHGQVHIRWIFNDDISLNCYFLFLPKTFETKQAGAIGVESD